MMLLVRPRCCETSIAHAELNIRHQDVPVTRGIDCFSERTNFDLKKNSARPLAAHKVPTNKVPTTKMPPRRVGVIGYGKIGKFLVERMLAPDCPSELHLVFVFDTLPDALDGSVVPESLRLGDLADWPTRSPDLIVEVTLNPCVPPSSPVPVMSSHRSPTRTSRRRGARSC